MAMRITQGMLADRTLRDLQAGQREVARLQEQVSTGRKVLRPSDDPLAARNAVLRGSELEAVDAHREAVDEATGWLQATDAVLGRVGNVLSRAKELALQAANGTLDQAGRERIAIEVDQLVQSAKDAGNAQQGGRFLLAGTATTAPPYAAGASDAYAGDAGNVVRQVGPGVAVAVNVRGDAVLGGGQAAADGLALDALRDLADQLRGGTPGDLQAIRTTSLQALDRNIDLVATTRASVGATQNRVDAAAARLDEVQGTAEKVLDGLVGADLTESLLQLNAQKSAYEAALQTGARLIQPSLLDFLR
jgi:flagellar hook-associated protein 3 FlgL